MSGPLVVSQNEVDIFRSCRWKWWLRYIEGLKPKARGRALSKGSGYHAGIAAAYLKTQETDDVAEIERAAKHGVLKHFLDEADAHDWHLLDEETQELARECDRLCMRGIQAFVLPMLRDYVVIAVELDFLVPLRDAAGTKRPRVQDMGGIDLLLYHKPSGEFIVDEHKTSSSDVSTMDARLDLHPQTPGYVYAVREWLRGLSKERLLALPDEVAKASRDARVGKVRLNCIRTKGMSYPNTNKVRRADVCPGCEKKHTEECDNALATAKMKEDDGHSQGRVSPAAVDCDRETYLSALSVQSHARGISIDCEQTERLDQLPTVGDRWACQHEWFYSEADIDRWRTEQLGDAKLIRLARRGKMPLTRNGSYCTPQNAFPCAYRSVCVNDSPELREEGFVIDFNRGGTKR